MISSIFGKTKPINYIIVLTFLFFFYWLVQIFLYDRAFDTGQFLLQTLILGVLMFSFFVVNFIVKRNKMTGINSFTLLFYVLLMVLFPETLADNYAVGCSFFLLLALRRLISIRSLKDIKLKIFDATIWIMLCSLCYDWAILYMILVFVAIYIYEPKNIRNWMVPFAGVFAFFLIAYALSILAGYEHFLWEHYRFDLNLESSRFMDLAKSIKRVVYIVLILITGLLSFVKLGKVGLGKIVTMRLLALTFVIGLALEVLLSGSEAHPMMVTFFPAVVFLTSYVESIRKPNIKEIVLMASILAPFLVLATHLLIGE
jgi:hypothetical protein